MSEKRNSARNPSFLGGTITYNHDLWSADCVVKNLSEGGARLSGRNLPALPDKFDLSIPQRNVKYRVQMRWRVGDQIGVAFEHAYPSAEMTPEVKAARRQRRVEQDEAQSLRPKRLITDLAI
ncbi:MAG TPA: PilZ domain-containing protein [Xanthobacteraceae bacterium]|jgi:hypothetical protein|nr:PilZ domain-containing protein [Xanthobacteraceae bacterium]